MKMGTQHQQVALAIIPVVRLLVSLRANSSHCPFIGIIRHFIHSMFLLIKWMKSRLYHRRLYSPQPHWSARMNKKILIECYLPKLEEKRRQVDLIYFLPLVLVQLILDFRDPEQNSLNRGSLFGSNRRFQLFYVASFEGYKYLEARIVCSAIQ